MDASSSSRAQGSPPQLLFLEAATPGAGSRKKYIASCRTRCQLRDAPPASGTRDPPALPSGPRGRVRTSQLPDARRGAWGEEARAGRSAGARALCRPTARGLTTPARSSNQPQPAPLLLRPAAPDS